MKQLLSDIHSKLIEIRPNDASKRMKLVRKYFPPNLKHLLSHRFHTPNIHISLINLGGSSIILKINTKFFRILYIEPKKEYFSRIHYEFQTLSSHDFGILAPLNCTFIPNIAWYYEIIPARPYQGATLKELSSLLHKVLLLSKYNLFWTDIHNDNLMRDSKNNLVIVDFDTGSIDMHIKSDILKHKSTKLSDITPHLDKYFSSPSLIKTLRYMIFAYLKIPITNENWMKFCFGEYMYRCKYNIDFRYPTKLFEAQQQSKGYIKF